ncbi:MAG TPA: GNAT family N-acetyltransferase [Candidatus Binatia bacterium]|nr:GNAT family N-acetyltransferase [Candidatus Binatia bacterium]
MSGTPTLAGAGIVLRPLVAADAPALFIALSDPVVQRYRRDAAHANIEETARYIQDTLARSRAAWTITEGGGEALGRLALRVPEASVGEFGIVIRREAQRRGLGLRALLLAELHAFNVLGLTRLTADVDSGNIASLALFRRAGFSDEILLQAHHTTKLGLRDSIVLAKHPS